MTMSKPVKYDQQIWYCSFCGKSQEEVTKLIAGPTVFICNECVDVCHDICHEKKDSHQGTDHKIDHKAVLQDVVSSVDEQLEAIQRFIANYKD